MKSAGSARIADAVTGESSRFLADLVTRRSQIVEMIRAERQREKRVTVKRVTKSIAWLVAALEKELAELDLEIDETVRGSPALRIKEDLLSSVPGAGTKTPAVLLGDLPELGTLDRKKIVSLAGLASYTRRSGRWRGKSIIGGGRKPGRSALLSPRWALAVTT